MSTPGNSIETNIGQILRNAAIQQARQYSGCESLEIAEMDSNFALGQVISRRMTLIVISGSELTILFKAHFKTSEGARLRRARDNTPPPDQAIAIAETTDCMKELTNLICGQICRTFQRNDLTLGMCIPLAMRGFYELYADYTHSEKPLTKFGQAWQITGDFGALVCTAYVEIANINALNNLQYLDEPPVNDDDEMEFL